MKTTTTDILAGSAAILLIVALLAILACGCRNAGTYAIVGDLNAPVDISDGSDTVNVRALFSLTGAKVWSARDSKVTMTYTNIYTNAYFGIVDTHGIQNFHVETEPLDVSDQQYPPKEEESQK